MAEMARYTAAPNEELLGRLLAEFDRMPEVLVVLNHPYCTEQRISRALQVEELTRFLAAHGSRMHALELNGLQPASDNREVVRLSRETGIPPISGGDRHCLEPNANLNLTNAGSFAEFVDEVRVQKLPAAVSGAAGGADYRIHLARGEEPSRPARPRAVYGPHFLRSRNPRRAAALGDLAGRGAGRAERPDCGDRVSGQSGRAGDTAAGHRQAGTDRGITTWRRLAWPCWPIPTTR